MLVPWTDMCCLLTVGYGTVGSKLFQTWDNIPLLKSLRFDTKHPLSIAFVPAGVGVCMCIDK